MSSLPDDTLVVTVSDGIADDPTTSFGSVPASPRGSVSSPAVSMAASPTRPNTLDQRTLLSSQADEDESEDSPLLQSSRDSLQLQSVLGSNPTAQAPNPQAQEQQRQGSSYSFGRLADSEVKSSSPQRPAQQADGDDDDGDACLAWAMQGPPVLRRLHTVFWRVVPSDCAPATMWHIIVCMFVAYSCITIPLRLAFRVLWHQHPIKTTFEAMDYTGDVLFLIDIAMNFRFSIVEDGVISTNRKKIAHKYLRSAWFPLEVTASLPLDLFVWSSWTHVALRTVKFCRIPRTLARLQDFEFLTVHGTALELFKLAAGVTFVVHVIACAYFGLSYAEGFAPDEGHWVPPVTLLNATLPRQYLRAFYYSSCTLLNCGVKHSAPETDKQMGFAMTLGYLNTFLLAIIVGKITRVIAELNATSEEFRARMRTLNTFMTTRALPKPLQETVRRYFFHQWSHTRGMSDEKSQKLLASLPCNLKSKVTDSIYGQVVRRIDLFAGCDEDFYEDLSQYLAPRIYAPGDTVLGRGEDAEELFFLNQGLVDVIIDDEVVAVLGDGSIIGEVALFSPTAVRTASVIAKNWSEFYSLSRAHFEDLCAKHPAESAKIQRMANERLSRSLLRQKVSEHVIFSSTPRSFQKALCESFSLFELTQKNGCIFVGGEPAESFIFIGSGRVEKFQKKIGFGSRASSLKSVKSPDDVTFHCHELEAGTFVDLELLCEKAPVRSCTVLAKGSVMLLALPYAECLRIAKQHNCEDKIVENVQQHFAIRRTSLRATFVNSIMRVRKELHSFRALGGFFGRHRPLQTDHSLTRSVGSPGLFPDIAGRMRVDEHDLMSMEAHELAELQKLVLGVQGQIASALGARCLGTQPQHQPPP
eukprot:m.164599 g.164599  ORF g.164599 m.164599 type:complete len:868 (+) comp17718_c1_seq7:124-2727(+)